MKTAVPWLVLLAWVALYLPVKGWDSVEQTYVSNASGSFGITATILYDFAGDPQFINRTIGPGKYQGDQYSGLNCQTVEIDCDPYPVKVHLNIDGSTDYGLVNCGCDSSIVLVDNAGGHGLDVYGSRYGTLFDPTPPLLMTIYTS